MTQNEASTGSQIDTKLTRGRSLDVLAGDLRRLRPSYPNLGTRSGISLLIGQCESWQAGGNKDALRRAMETTMRRIEHAADWQGDR